LLSFHNEMFDRKLKYYQQYKFLRLKHLSKHSINKLGTIKIILLYLIVCVTNHLEGQNLKKINGFLGVYHTSTGFIYSDTTGADSVPMQNEFKFGELAFPNQSIDNGFGFISNIDSCINWNSNKIIGIIQPTTEGGVYNQPNDTLLFSPYDIKNEPGMVQGGQRFSKLSQLYGPFCGVIIDDWNSDTLIAHQVRDAVQGKYVDENGNVHYESIATTPYNKLYAVMYDTWLNTSSVQFLDGVSYWYFKNQNCCYTQLDSDILQLRAYWPKRDILIGIYIKNSYLGWTDPNSVHYMLQHSLNSYDNGDINGITFFAGIDLVKSIMPLNQWKAFALPMWLDSLYFPYLGEAGGKIYDCDSNKFLTEVFVRVYCKGRISGDTLMRSRQKSDSTGEFHFGLWAGNRNTDSTYYWAIAEKAGYDNDTIGFWVKRNQYTSIPNLPLCHSKMKITNNTNGDFLLFPNPANELLNIKSSTILNGEIEITDLIGRANILQTVATFQTTIDISNLKSGLYYLKLKNYYGLSVTKKFVKQ